MKLISSLISLTFITIITVFAISNREVVEVSMFPFDNNYSLPLYAVILFSILLGFIWGIFIMSWSWLKAHVKNHTLHHTIRRHIDS